WIGKRALQKPPGRCAGSRAFRRRARLRAPGGAAENQSERHDNGAGELPSLHFNLPVRCAAATRATSRGTRWAAMDEARRRIIDAAQALAGAAIGERFRESSFQRDGQEPST